MSEIWGGRFSEKLDELMVEFNASIDVDKQLYAFDIKGSIAYAAALKEIGVLSADEFKQIKAGLEEIRAEIETGNFDFQKQLEDIHMNIESQLRKKIGDVAKKLHTGRSRNEQVVLDEKLFIKETGQNLVALLVQYIKTLLRLAEANKDLIFPAYTHLQPAQPVLLAQYFLAYAWRAKRNIERLRFFLDLLDESPLGVGAVAGTTYHIDRQKLAESLGFARVAQNSMDAVASRDFMLDILYATMLILLDLSQLAEDMIIYAMPYTSFLELPDAFCTGSSLMPQKKNPDALELIRGRAARGITNLSRLAIVLKGIPMTYNKDLQEDKEPLFDSIYHTQLALRIIINLLKGIKVNKDKISQVLNMGYLEATDLADYLVSKGIAFRDAHRIVGEIVKYALNKGVSFQEMGLEEFRKFCDVIEDDVYDWLKLENVIARRDNIGGTAQGSVLQQIKNLQKFLEGLQ